MPGACDVRRCTTSRADSGPCGGFARVGGMPTLTPVDIGAEPRPRPAEEGTSTWPGCGGRHCSSSRSRRWGCSRPRAAAARRRTPTRRPPRTGRCSSRPPRRSCASCRPRRARPRWTCTSPATPRPWPGPWPMAPPRPTSRATRAPSPWSCGPRLGGELHARRVPAGGHGGRDALDGGGRRGPRRLGLRRGDAHAAPARQHRARGRGQTRVRIVNAGTDAPTVDVDLGNDGSVEVASLARFQDSGERRWCCPRAPRSRWASARVARP